jgi:hypothetical protein
MTARACGPRLCLPMELPMRIAVLIAFLLAGSCVQAFAANPPKGPSLADLMKQPTTLDCGRGKR